MIIIGITGTIGAGKGTVVDYLIEVYGYTHYSVRKYLTELLIENKLPVNRDTMTDLANSLRFKYNSSSYIIEQLYERASKSRKHCIIESIRTTGEIDVLRSIGNFFLLAVDADATLRYDRIWSRNSETDAISYETFIADEAREMQTLDPNKQNLGGCILRADHTIKNNSDINTLYENIDVFMKEIVQHERFKLS